jgi:predicted dithiol-disulfide oxidoreductase (DUF899 family)
MNPPKIVDRESWLEARLKLLAKEKAFDKERDALTRTRQALPWVAVEKEYVFGGPAGPETLSDVFDGRSQLIVYHFMYHPSWGDQACPSCSFWADNFNGIIVHLNARDVSMVAISKATIDQINAYKKRMGWSFKWLSSYSNEFNRDYSVSFTDDEVANEDAYYNYKRQRVPREEMPGMSVFAKDDGGMIYHTYSSYGRGIDMINGAYHLLDRVPKGRDEAGLPWNQAWTRRHDEYVNE